MRDAVFIVSPKSVNLGIFEPTRPLRTAKDRGVRLQARSGVRGAAPRAQNWALLSQTCRCVRPERGRQWRGGCLHGNAKRCRVWAAVRHEDDA
eukprot:352515-Chlamydomonas_euryale.AAC.3